MTDGVSTHPVLPWQQDQWELLRSWRARQRMPHAILLKGRQGLGKLEFARAIAQAAQCLNPTSLDTACGECGHCHLFQAGSSPDYHALEPEQGKTVISIDQVRELCRKMNLTSQQGSTKLAVIVPAESMSAAAANSLLKTLEEPAGDSLILLVSHAAAQLPITIRSRCQSIELQGDYSPATEQWLAAHEPEIKDPSLLLRLADGAPLLARELHRQDELKTREQIMEGIGKLMGRKVNPSSIAESWLKLGLQRIVHWTWMLVEDAIRLKQGAESQTLRNRDVLPILQPLAEQLDYQVLFQLLDWSLDARRVLQRNLTLNQQLMLDELTITWRNASR